MLVAGRRAPVLLPGGTEPDLGPGERLVAVDLDGRAPDDAVARGDAAARRPRPPRSSGSARQRLAAGDVDDLARLVPEYVTLPRGVRDAPAEAVEVSGGRATAR